MLNLDLLQVLDGSSETSSGMIWYCGSAGKLSVKPVWICFTGLTERWEETGSWETIKADIKGAVCCTTSQHPPYLSLMCTGNHLSTACPPKYTGCRHQICPGSQKQENHFPTLRVLLGPLQGSCLTSSLWKNKNKKGKISAAHLPFERKKGFASYVLVLMFSAAEVRLVLFHWVQFNLADGALVALQCGSCWQVQKAHILNLCVLSFFLTYMEMLLIAVLAPGAEDGPYVSISFCLVTCLRCLLPT